MREFRFREAKQSEKGHTANWRQSYKLDPSLVLKSEDCGAGRWLRFESFTSWFVIMWSSAGHLAPLSLNFFISKVRLTPLIGMLGMYSVAVNTVLGMWKVLWHYSAPSPPGFLWYQPSHPTPLSTSKVILAAWYFPLGHSHLEARPLSYVCWQSPTSLVFATTEGCESSYLHWILVFLDDIFTIFPSSGHLCPVLVWSVVLAGLGTLGSCNHSLPPKLSIPIAPSMQSPLSLCWDYCPGHTTSAPCLGTWALVNDCQKVIDNHSLSICHETPPLESHLFG